jgi:hypothetical protein
MTIEQTLQNEIQESQRALDGPIDDTIYRRDHFEKNRINKLGFGQYEKSGYRYL